MFAPGDLVRCRAVLASHGHDYLNHILDAGEIVSIYVYKTPECCSPPQQKIFVIDNAIGIVLSASSSAYDVVTNVLWTMKSQDSVVHGWVYTQYIEKM